MSLESSKKGRRVLSPESADDIIIPPEIFADEILPRLPATNLQSSLIKLVCKDWLNLISSPGFTRRQLLLGSNRSIRILVPQSNGIISIYYDKHGCVSSKEKEVLIPFPHKKSFGGGKMPQILGSCDGLILLANKPPNDPMIYFAVFNPSTGKSESFTVLKHDGYLRINCPCFGHHPATGEYILVLCESTTVSLYTFSSKNKLRAVQSCSVRPQTPNLEYESQVERGILLDGVVYWLAQWYGVGGHSIVYIHTISGYRIQENEYFEFSPPRQTYFKLGVLDGCLLAINKRKEARVFEVWVMKETSVWTKLRDIDGGCNDEFMMLYPLTFFPNGDLIMEGDACILTRYDFDRNKATFLNRFHPSTSFSCITSRAIVCADSLVSPTIVMEKGDCRI